MAKTAYMAFPNRPALYRNVKNNNNEEVRAYDHWTS
jgi:hypothetical protein